MTWTKVGHEWEKKSERLSVPAALAHFELLMLSNDRDLDLDVPYDLLHRLAHPVTTDVLDELVRAGIWSRVPPVTNVDGGVVEPGFLHCEFHPEWQLKAHVVEHKRRQNALRQERKRSHDADNHDICTERCLVIKRAHDSGNHDLCRRSPYATCSVTDPIDTHAVTRDETSDDPRHPARVGLGSARVEPPLTSGRESEEQETHAEHFPDAVISGAQRHCYVCLRPEADLLAPLVKGWCDQCARTAAHNAERRKSA